MSNELMFGLLVGFPMVLILLYSLGSAIKHWDDEYEDRLDD